MKVYGFPPVASPVAGGARRPAAAGAASFRQALQKAGHTSESAPAAAPLAAAALLAVLEVDDPGERRRRAIRRGEELLDGLEAIRDGLLAGEIDPSVLQHIAERARVQLPDPDDPRLASVLREIEVRAAVELAKYQPIQD